MARPYSLFSTRRRFILSTCLRARTRRYFADRCQARTKNIRALHDGLPKQRQMMPRKVCQEFAPASRDSSRCVRLRHRCDAASPDRHVGKIKTEDDDAGAGQLAWRTLRQARMRPVPCRLWRMTAWCRPRKRSAENPAAQQRREHPHAVSGARPSHHHAVKNETKAEPSITGRTRSIDGEGLI